MKKSMKVFVLGDSRTGTTTLHKFLRIAGFNSIHYFFKESGVTNPAHMEFEENWGKLKKFIDESDYDAFSDYPLRTFYKKLFETYPDAYFILTVRKDLDTWRKSMEGFFSKFNIALDLDGLSKVYLETNEDIRRISDRAKFCEINIDESSQENGAKLSKFLGLEDTLSLGWENSTDHYDNSMWSTRVTLFNATSSDKLSYVKRLLSPSKAMLSEYGWVYLINDSSEFMDYYLGAKSWSEDQRNKAADVFKLRVQALDEKTIRYLKFVVPEKAVIYPHYLPKIFADQVGSTDRPAVGLSKDLGDFFSYTMDLLKDVRSYGHVYFRGDTHVNWLGAFFLYQHVVERLNVALKDRPSACRAAFPLSAFEASMASYAGDIFVQLDKEYRSFFDGAWQPLNLGGPAHDKLEHLVRYALPPSNRSAVPGIVEDDYLKLLGTERKTFRFSHPDKNLPRAVIFRDSTADYLVEPLAEHFSESLFIWHKGLVYSDVIEREKPDVVLHIMAERFLVQYQSTPAFVQLGLPSP